MMSKHYRLKDIYEGGATVLDDKQLIARGAVTHNNGMKKHWVAEYFCEPYVDRSGSENTIEFTRVYRAGDAKHMAHLIDDIAVSPVTGRKTGALLFRTRHDAASFVVANG